MAKKRRTQADRDRERAAADRSVREHFIGRLRDLQTYDDARKLVSESPPPDAPGRSYYSNLAFFLDAFTVPFSSSYGERQLYVQFIQRLDAAGALKPGAGARVVADLERQMELQGPW